MWIVKIKTWDGTDAGTEYIGPFPFREMAEIALKHFRTLNTVTKSKVVGLSAPSSLIEYDDLSRDKPQGQLSSWLGLAPGPEGRRQALSVSRFCTVTGSSPSARISLTRFQGFLECALEGAGGEHPDYTFRDYEEDESLRHGETYARRLARELIAQYNHACIDETDEL